MRTTVKRIYRRLRYLSEDDKLLLLLAIIPIALWCVYVLLTILDKLKLKHEIAELDKEFALLSSKD